MNKQVIMNAEIRFYFDFPYALADLLEQNKINLDIGDFAFRINGKSIPFGFDADGYNVSEDNIVSYETGKGPFFNNCNISDDIFDEDYAKLSMTREDINAPFLASADGIEEFYLYIEGEHGKEVPFVPELLSICFSDENGTQYPVRQEVLTNYNDAIRRECKNR